jgi:2-amino-4-hydroxy-6-hydroxymethyldihydropteridine diphosphokinase
MSCKSTVYLGLGSNLADPITQIKTALIALQALPDTQLLRHSSLYQSSPLGNRQQPDYINAVAVLNTTLPPLILLHHLQDIEKQQGRVRSSEKWASRTLDLDILMYDQQQSKETQLTLPHPGLYDRAFVLYPLYECAPHLILPNGQRLQTFIQSCPTNGLRKIIARDTSL